MFQPTASDNLRSLILHAQENSHRLVELYYSLTIHDWAFIWSVIKQPSWWGEADHDFHIEYLLCDCFMDLYHATDTFGSTLID